MGFAAAITAQRLDSVVTMPALEMEMVCCSIASWMAVRSWSLILSNSSIRQIPESASTMAPPSSVYSPVWWSFLTLAVRPAAEAPLPVVNTALWLVFSTYFKHCDLAIPGSPRMSTLMSPRMRCWPAATFCTPPNMAIAMDVFTCFSP